MEWKRLLFGISLAIALGASNCGGGNNGDPVCGDGKLENNFEKGILEFCDDSNTTEGDGCNAKCRLEFDAENHVCDLGDSGKNAFGGCCNSDDDCNGLTCIGGICSLIGCTANAECQALADDADELGLVNARPHPEGTTYGCADINGNGICVAGSGLKCDSAADARCAADETCIPSVDLGNGTLAGNCSTNVLGAGKPGEFCAGQGSTYECGGGSLQIGINCFNNSCISACNPNDGILNNVACPTSFECVELGDLFQDGQFVGGGYCLPPSCGVQELGNPANEFVDVDACSAGQTCSADLLDLFFELDIIGDQADGLSSLRCGIEPANGVQDGQPCENDTFFGSTCHDAGLCLQAAAVQNPAGEPCLSSADCCPDGPANCDQQCVGTQTLAGGTCSNRPAPGLCTSSCASEADCDGLVDPLCADIGLLTVFDPAGAACQNDNDCNAGFNCEPNPANAAQLRCSPSVDIPTCFAFTDFLQPGTDQCAAEADCTTVGEGCLPMAFAGIGDRSTGGLCNAIAGATKFVGDPCTDPGECLSGFCFDENFGVELAPGTPSQRACSSICTVNADCGAGQGCFPVLTNANDFDGDAIADDPNDDTVIGLCFTLTPADPADNCVVGNTAGHNSCEVNEAIVGVSCTLDADCNTLTDLCFNGTCSPSVVGEGDSCDTVSDACFTNNAVVGSACSDNVDCDLGATCLGAVGGSPGFCVFNGCDAVADSGCPSANDVCLGNGNTAPGTCFLGCTVGNDATCITVNAALTCQDVGLGAQGSCLLP
jgi:cysteine-rich repeat protein